MLPLTMSMLATVNVNTRSHRAASGIGNRVGEAPETRAGCFYSHSQHGVRSDVEAVGTDLLFCSGTHVLM